MTQAPIEAVVFDYGGVISSPLFRGVGRFEADMGYPPGSVLELLFGGDVSGNFIAFDPSNGKPLWHTQIGQVTNAPETYMVDGRQHILVAAGDTLYAFTLYQ